MRVWLKEKRPETADVMSFVFDLRGQALEYQPGQFAWYELDELAVPDVRGKRRHFTLSSSPTEKGVAMLTTRLRGSGFKETLRRAEPGYELTLESARGSFVLPEDDPPPSQVLVAGGIGVTPYRSMLRYAVDSHRPLRATFFYFNRTLADVIYKQELESMLASLPDVRLIYVLAEPPAGWAGESGHLTEALLRKYVPDLQQPNYWLSGPPPMVNAYAELIGSLGSDPEMVHKDNFTGY
jgi:ferredoxin-NADP reductase